MLKELILNKLVLNKKIYFIFENDILKVNLEKLVLFGYRARLL